MSEAQLIDGRWYKVSSQVVQDCTKLLDQQLLQHLPLIDLSDFTVGVERIGKHAWDATHHVGDAIPADSAAFDPQLERIMTKVNSVQLQLKMRYSFM